MLHKLDVDSILIRNLNDWNDYTSLHQDSRALIIPGGESTAMLRIMKDEGLLVPIRNAINSGMPVFGTCAGMIVLAKEIEGEDRERIATMDIIVRRNAYGRQLGSFFTHGKFSQLPSPIPMTFIRAPYISKVNDGVEVLSVVDDHIVAARQGNQLVCSFHPELNDDLSIHAYFVNKICATSSVSSQR